MPSTVPFSLDAASVPFVENLTVIIGDDNKVTVRVTGLAASDAPVQAAFTAKLNASDSDTAPTTVQKIVSQTAGAMGQIVNVGPGTWDLVFPLLSADETAFLTSHVYSVKFWNDVGGATVAKTLQTGTIVAVAGMSSVGVLAGGTAQHVSITPEPATCPQFGTFQLTATCYDGSWNLLNGRTVSWSSSNPAVATVDATTGLVTGLTLGTTKITATVDGVSDQITLTVGFGVPTTVAQLVQAFNAAPAGATMLQFYAVGVNQTILPNGDAGLASPGTNSPTGYWCTKWDDAVTPNQGKHFRPDPALNNGNGAPCLVTGEPCGAGLHIPSGQGLGGGALFHPDAGKKTDTPIPNSGNLRAIFGDYSAGISYGGIGKLLSGASAVHVGEDADSNRIEGGLGDDFGNVVGLRNSIMWDDGISVGANRNSGGVFGTGGAPVMLWMSSVNRTTEPEAVGGPWENWRMSLIGRDIFIPTSMGTPDMISAASDRRVRLGGSYGASTVGQQRAQKAFFVLKGHPTSLQTQLLAGYADATYGAYNDSRRIGYLFGDSEFFEKINLQDQENIQNGVDGAQPIASFGYVSCAFSGMRPQLMLHPLTYYIRGLDWSKRPLAGVAFWFSEWINATPANETLTDTIAQNYYVCDQVRAMDPTRVRVAMHNMVYADNNFDNQQTLNNPAIPNDLNANAVAQGHADFVVNYLDSVLWNADPQLYGPVGDYNRQPSSGTWNGIHPYHIGQVLWYARVRNGFKAAMGENVGVFTQEIFSSIPVVNLSAGTPTATPSWTPKNYAGTPLGGVTLSFASWIHVPAQSHDDEKLDATVCTVDPVSGLITRDAAGVALVVATSSDGGKGLCVVVCS